MKPMLKTEDIVYSLDYIIDTFTSFTSVNDSYNPYIYTADELASQTTAIVNKLQTIETADIKTEFSIALDSFEEIIPLRHIMEVNFKKMLDWKYNSTAEYTANEQELSEEIEEFMVSFYNEGNEVTVVDKDTICNNYLKIGYHITFLKIDLIKLLAQWKEMGAPFSKIGTEKNKSKSASEKNELRFRLSNRKNTDFIKILSAMYDVKMFTDAEGNPATNKQKLMDAFGEFLGEDFSAYSASLSQAKNRDEKTFLKPFKEIEKEALRYFNAVGE